MLKAFLERRRIEKTFAKYVSPEVARQIADGSLAAPGRSERVIEFAFIVITASDGPSYSARAAALAETALHRGGVVKSLLPLVVVGFGVIDSAGTGDRAGFIADVQFQFADAAVVHGRVAAEVGSFGSSSRLDVGFWWPGMVAALRHLATLSPGQAHEFH